MAPRDYVEMPFGRHRGRLLRDVPSSYLDWVLHEVADLRSYLRVAIKAELERRDVITSRGSSTRHPAPVEWQDLLGKVRRELAMKHHPDRGGDLATMAGINLALDRVEQMVRVA